MNATPTPQIDFWKWLREHAHESVSPKFAIIHPAAIRKMAAECFGLRNVPDVWNWQKKNQRRITRTINEGLKAHSLRLSPSINGTGYAHVKRIPA